MPRQKHVCRNSNVLVNAWVAQEMQRGRTRTGYLSFEGRDLYSHSTLIARMLTTREPYFILQPPPTFIRSWGSYYQERKPAMWHVRGTLNAHADNWGARRFAGDRAIFLPCRKALWGRGFHSIKEGLMEFFMEVHERLRYSRPGFGSAVRHLQMLDALEPIIFRFCAKYRFRTPATLTDPVLLAKHAEFKGERRLRLRLLVREGVPMTLRLDKLWQPGALERLPRRAHKFPASDYTCRVLQKRKRFVVVMDVLKGKGGLPPCKGLVLATGPSRGEALQWAKRVFEQVEEEGGSNAGA